MTDKEVKKGADILFEYLVEQLNIIDALYNTELPSGVSKELEVIKILKDCYMKGVQDYSSDLRKLV